MNETGGSGVQRGAQATSGEAAGAAMSGRIGVAVFGRDGQALLHTPGFVELLGLGLDVISPERTLDQLLTMLGDTHPVVERLATGQLRCRTEAGRSMEIAFERLIYDRCCVSITDVSERRAVEDELRRAQAAAEAASQAKSRFLATMSHELRTPLNAVIGFSDALTREATGSPSVPVDRERLGEFSAAIQQAGQHLLNLINNILDVARIESGRFDLASDLIDVAHMMHGCARQSTEAARAAGVTLDVSVPPNLPRLRGDERRLRQVMAHLLTNAVKFTPAGGRAMVSVDTAADRDLLVRVRDSGIGIAESDIERVFEPFNQLDTGLARRASGTGLGLYFCRALVQAHGGHLTLESKPGEGTEATVRLPHTRLIASPPLALVQEHP